ncbi:hypothetical protein KSW81_008414 [Nannochloris sp. 'desiccata']|nr:hypothetical protein KSW81_008414 [Chlorella desiccata (nom. nud.)]
MHDGVRLAQFGPGQLGDDRGEGLSIQCREISLPEKGLRCRDRGVDRSRAVHEARDLERQALLRRATEGFVAHEFGVALDLGPWQEREDLEPVDHVGIVGVEPELVHRVGARHRRVEPDGIALALAELAPIGVRDERGADRVHGRPLGFAHEVDAAREIAPLVAAAGLQHAAVVEVQAPKVEALQDLVAELGVADALVAVEARAHGVFLEHRADAVVLADVAQELDRAHRRRPVEVVDELRGIRPLEGEEARHLALQVAHPFRDHGLVVQGAL